MDIPRSSRRLVLTATLFLATVPSVEAKQPLAEPVEDPATAPAETAVRDGVRWDPGSGLPVAIYAPRTTVPPGHPEVQARWYLSRNRDLLQLRDADLADLELAGVRRGRAVTAVRFRQRVGGVPVWGPHLVVSLDLDDRVVFVMSPYQPDAPPVDTGEVLAAAEARDIALAHLGRDAELPVRTELMVYPGEQGALAVWRVLSPGPPGRPSTWEVLVDAAAGTIVRAEDITCYATTDGTGNVFEPDPLSSTLATYGDPGFTDGGDADTTQLTGEVVSVTLDDINETSGTYFLDGPYASVLDWDSPFKGDFSQASDTWDVTRSADAFEAVNGYHHIDTFLRYINETLGIPVQPYQYSGGVRFDPHGWDGADQSSYSSFDGLLTFGEGGVDDAEDADVLIHELSHGIHDWLTSGGLSQVEGLGEGVADYLAVSYSRSFNQWTASHPQQSWVFSWDGHNEFWSGRVADWNDSHTYPGDLAGLPYHLQGQMFSSCLMDVWEANGRHHTDAALLEGLAMTSSASNQNDAAQAVINAAAALSHPPAEIQAMHTILAGCGYTVTLPSVPALFEDGFETGDTTRWSATVP